MVSISLCMIVKNEEDVIGKCLDCVKDIVDEIIIVDTGSTDKTKEIVKKYTNKIYDFQWIDDFSAARNFSFSKATKDYIFWLDADDILLEDDRLKLMQLKKQMIFDIDVVMMRYNYSFDSHGNPILSFFRERLFKRSNGYKWVEPIHECIEPWGNIINSDITITHSKVHATSSDRNIKIFEKQISKGKELSPRGMFYYARELYYHSQYNKAIEYFNKFINLDEGWVEDKISACYDLSICYKNIDDTANRLTSLLKSLTFDKPRAEICCELGYCCKDLNEYEEAIFWFKSASNAKKPKENWGFILPDYYGYIPNIELCTCYDRLGKIEEAMKYNLKAEEYKPNDSSVFANKKYFESINFI